MGPGSICVIWNKLPAFSLQFFDLIFFCSSFLFISLNFFRVFVFLLLILLLFHRKMILIFSIKMDFSSLILFIVA